MRLEFWYFFGLFALALIFLRVRASRQANWKDPVVLAFSLGPAQMTVDTYGKKFPAN